MKKFTGMLMLFSSLTAKAQVGIGTTTPLARLHVTDSSVLFSAAGDTLITPGNTPVSGEGRRMMWYADKAAFRVGYLNYYGRTFWDKTNIGVYSFASGLNTYAPGAYSFASGNYSYATGKGSTAMGSGWADGEYSTALGANSQAFGYAATASGFSNASGNYSTAMGYSSNATGINSTAMGSSTTASGHSSTSMGGSTTASGIFSVAMGGRSIASGNYSVAMGNAAIASGTQSIAIGSSVSTNNHTGSFFFGDSDPHSKGMRLTGVDNEFAARFNGGYFFITDDVGSDIGVRVAPGGNSWSAISDINRKENFEPVDGNDFLDKIASFKLTSWNYKGQNVKTFRHYGPMAQEFYKAFGKDDYGTIGCDTLINQQDFLGVNLIAIQALEKRTAENKKENKIQSNMISDLKKDNADFKKENDALKIRLDRVEKILADKQ